METELKAFKEKIKIRYSNREISKDYYFPRSISTSGLLRGSKLFNPEHVYKKGRLKASNFDKLTKYFSNSFY